MRLTLIYCMVRKMNKIKLPLSVLAIAASCALLLAACGGDEDSGSTDSRLSVTASFYPLYEAAQAIGGDQAEVVNLTPTGTGPHDLELTPKTVAEVEDADLNIYLGQNFQPAVEKAAGQSSGRSVDLLDGIQLRPADDGIPGVEGEVDGERLAAGMDPHVWVDPVRFLEIVDEITAAYIEADPGNADTWKKNARAYSAGLESLDDDFQKALKNCATRTLVTSHAAFGYLADRYGLVQAPIAGISPDDEPNPQSIAAVARRAEQDGVKTVFFETLVPRKLADTVAGEIGARSDALDPVEGLDAEGEEAGKTYESIQRDNMERLRTGLGCTTT